ncbi:MAG: cation transporter, partial [Oscillospiraceae bacterium]|nr:cation transporter [Oscillospiraceae bacterium]
MGIELGRSSIEKIINPVPIEAGVLPAAILLASILVKVYMCLYNRATAKKINSAAMEATAKDSLSDSVSTLVVLLAMAASYVFDINIDGWAGLAVAVLIIFTGYGALKDTLSPLLGKAPEPELVDTIEKIVMSHPEICGIHDLIVNDYGPGRLVISLHAEVNGAGNIFELHDAIDRAEVELKEELGCVATIHMDPIEADNTEVAQHRQAVSDLIREKISPKMSIHDFRMVPGPTHTNLIFDVVVPPDYPEKDEAVAAQIRELVHSTWDEHYAVITVDRAYA